MHMVLDNSAGAMKSSKPRSGQRSKKRQDSRRDKNQKKGKGYHDDGSGGDGQEEAEEEAEAAALDSEAFARGRFGAVPRFFGGCRLDFFSLDKEEEEVEGDDSHTNQDDYGNDNSTMDNNGRDKKKANRDTQDTQVLLSLKTLQRGYLPSAFDSEEEWAEVKDYLWLLGQVYTRKAATEDGVGQGDESQEEYKADAQVASVHLLQSQSQDDDSSNSNSAASLRRHNLEREMTHLHHLVRH